MQTRTVSYSADDVEFSGHLVYDPQITKKRPAVLVAHAWMGQDSFARKKAAALAQMGYVGFAADVYGHGKAVSTKEEAAALMRPLFANRKALQQRIIAAYRTLQEQPEVDPHRIGAIGFCFGGLTVIELFRSGVDLKGVVTFHGTLGNTMNGIHAQTTPMASNIHGSILILHGHDDPLVSLQDIVHIQKELTEAHVDWQMHIYGHTQHAFTNPEADDPSVGLKFNAQANARSWQSMTNFFKEIL